MRQEEDKIEEFEGAIIQHGKLNKRIYLMKIKNATPDNLVAQLEKKAGENKYSKIFAKIPRKKSGAFLNAGYRVEAEVPKFYSGEEDALFLGYYLSEERRRENDSAEIEKIIQLSREKKTMPRSLSDSLDESRFTIRRCREIDIERMAEIYRIVFPSYPFPIHDPAYLLKTMHSNVVYFGIETDGELIALSSAEMDIASQNVEMTDFATLPEWRGYGLARRLLAHMESYAKSNGIITAYTIARAISPGMNITFARNNYKYGGRLINNTNISGNIESMNVWYKSLLN